VLLVGAASDGLFRSDFSFDSSSPTEQISVGANGADFVHGWVRFIHAPTTIALVADGVVTSVTVGITKVAQGNDPATQRPSVDLRHADLGDSIEGLDYAIPGTPVSGGVFSPGAGVQTFEFDVTSPVIGDILAGRTYSDFVLATSGVATDVSSWIFEDEDAPDTDDEPYLRFRYTP
jgi:hypothetical protein